jgi:predicted PurR-regulated permease PerM
MAILISEQIDDIEQPGEAPAVPLDETPAVPTQGEPAPPTMGERYRLFALAAITFGCVVLCFLLAIPFLPAIAWGVALAIISWPMHRWIESAVRRPNIAAFLSTSIVTLLIAGTALYVGYHLAEEGTSAAEQTPLVEGKDKGTPDGGRQDPDQAEQKTDAAEPMRAAEAGVRQTLEKVPGLRNIGVWMDRMGIDPEQEIRKFVGSFTRDFSAVANGSVAAIVQFLAAVFLLFFLFRDRQTFLDGVVGLLPLTRVEASRVLTRAADSVHANLYATFLTSLITTTSIGAMFWWLDLPNPMLWTVVMFFLSLLPIVGAGLVWVPAAVYLAMEGRWMAGAVLIGWALLFFVLVDTILYAKIAGPKMRMHETLTLLAFFGGLAFFGISGMILGPAVLAVTAAFVEVWKVRLTGVDPSPAIVEPGKPTLVLT